MLGVDNISDGLIDDFAYRSYRWTIIDHPATIMALMALREVAADDEYKPGGANAKYNVIVAGARSAGAILASRLSENPRRSVAPRGPTL